MITTYSHADIRFGGIPIGTAHNLEVAQDEPVSVTKPVPEPFTVSGTVELNGEDADRFFAGVRRFAPVQPDAVVRLSMRWGILGTIQVDAWVQGVQHTKDDVRASTTMNGAVDARALRSAIATAVRRAIVDWRERARVATRALVEDVQRPMAEAYFGPDLTCRAAYRGERKQRKAMRRLLRAAGITRPS